MFQQLLLCFVIHLPDWLNCVGAHRREKSPRVRAPVGCFALTSVSRRRSVIGSGEYFVNNAEGDRDKPLPLRRPSEFPSGDSASFSQIYEHRRIREANTTERRYLW